MSVGQRAVLIAIVIYAVIVAAYLIGKAVAKKEHQRYGLTYKEIRNIVLAKEDGRLVILPTKSEEIIRIVELALRIKLYDWQKAYITKAADYIMPGRVSGKTTAYIVRFCITDGPPINIWEEIDRVIDEQHTEHYKEFFIHEVRRIYYELQRIGGMRLREISFEKHKHNVTRGARFVPMPTKISYGVGGDKDRG